jgi:predicted phage baseplate assembly protein
MALPAPNLDDRRFQALVDDAKRLVQQRCPEWTDHNVSDPGVTLIELFAWMTDQLVYRLNRVPDRQYVKFLELIGVTLFPPTAAHADVTFRLTGPQPKVVTIDSGTQVATQRTETDDAITFTTTDGLPIVPARRTQVGSVLATKARRYVDLAEELRLERPAACFQSPPVPDDALYIGLSTAVPSNTVRLRFRCVLTGHGIQPGREPIAWEAWTGDGWTLCDRESDSTAGFNMDGDVILHIPRGHQMHEEGGRRAGWIRAVVIPAQPEMYSYLESPQIRDVAATTIGGTVDAVHAAVIRDEDLGVSEGIPGQVFRLRHSPVVLEEAPPVLAVDGGETSGWETWTRVEDFAASGPMDRHFVFDAAAGEVRIGPAVRVQDGSLVRYGATPTKGRRLRMAEYRTGGGAAGNVAAGTLTVMKWSIKFVAGVTNRRGARGGVDGEDIENAKVRGPIRLRTRARAVTTEDFEHITREAAPNLRRVKAIAVEEDGKAGVVRVVVVPSAPSDAGRLRFEDLAVADATREAVEERLEECRTIGTRVQVRAPAYQGVIVEATITPAPGALPKAVKEAADGALYGYLNPISGGRDGNGWPFGRPVTMGEVYSILQAVPGAGVVDDVRLFKADAKAPTVRREEVARIDLPMSALIFSGLHKLNVPGAD